MLPAGPMPAWASAGGHRSCHKLVQIRRSAPDWPVWYPCHCKQAVDSSGASLGLAALLVALPRLQDAVEGGQAHTVVTQEVRLWLL